MTRVTLVLLGISAVASGATMEIIRQAVVVPAIKAQSSYSVGVSIFTIYTEVREYREQCRRLGNSARWWSSWWVSHLIFIASLLGLAATWAISLAEGEEIRP